MRIVPKAIPSVGRGPILGLDQKPISPSRLAPNAEQRLGTHLDLGRYADAAPPVRPFGTTS